MDKAQAAIEFLLIVGFIVAIIIPIIFYFQIESAKNTETLIIQHYEDIARRIADNANSVYFYGEPSRSTIDVNFPKELENIVVEQNQVIFYLKTSSGINTIGANAKPNLTGTIPKTKGLHKLTIESKDNYVQIS